MNQELATNMMRRFCVGDIFRRVALNKPDKTAIIYRHKGEESGEATFEELNSKPGRHG